MVQNSKNINNLYISNILEPKFLVKSVPVDSLEGYSKFLYFIFTSVMGFSLPVTEFLLDHLAPAPCQHGQDSGFLMSSLHPLPSSVSAFFHLQSLQIVLHNLVPSLAWYSPFCSKINYQTSTFPTQFSFSILSMWPNYLRHIC